MITRLKLKMLEVWPGSQNDLGLAAGINKARMSHYCLGRQPIPPHHLLALCQVLKCNPREIVGVVELAEVR
jgi:DNA-binding Xre family transcriptional regulator